MKNFRIFFAAALITAAFTMFTACDSALNTDLVTAESVRTSAKQSSIGLAPDTWISSDFGTEYSTFDTIESVAANGIVHCSLFQ